MKNQLTPSLVELINNLTSNNNLQTKEILQKLHDQSETLNFLQKFTIEFVNTMEGKKPNEVYLK